MTDKKGIGAVIAWVLLLGFTVALATTIFLWMKGQTETMSESTIEFAEGEMQCQNVRINVVNVGSKLNVHNVGYLTINQLSIRTIGELGEDSKSKLEPDPAPDCELNPDDCLKPQTSGTQCQPPSCGVISDIEGNLTAPVCTQIEVMPIIKIKTRMVGCKDRKVVIKC